MDESQRLSERIANCLPAASFELEVFCELVGIEASREIPSAAVTTGINPRMLVNPDFVEKYCSRDEHLFLLVMHELWHILLAHTRLYPRATQIDNIAFDAVINAGLALQFPEAEYRGFFEAINSPDDFPNLLLRPPAGWPDEPRFPEGLPDPVRQILERLYYPSKDDGKYAEPLYEEIRELLRRFNEETDKPVVLIGSHGHDDSQDQELMKNVLVREVVEKIVSAWPAPPIPRQGRSAGGSQESWSSLIGTSSQAAKQVFSGSLKRCFRKSREGKLQTKKQETILVGGSGVLPNPSDRLRAARLQLGLSGLLYQQSTPVKARELQQLLSHVYFDVSGSMSAMLPHLIGLVLPYLARREAKVFQFSTIVEPLPLEDVRQGKLTTTLGTDINCVLEHLFNHHVQRAMILTDGYTGRARDDHAQQLKTRKVQLHVVLTRESYFLDDLSGIAASMIILPPLA
jgi:Putative metallopeptidase domain